MLHVSDIVLDMLVETLTCAPTMCHIKHIDLHSYNHIILIDNKDSFLTVTTSVTILSLLNYVYNGNAVI